MQNLRSREGWWGTVWDGVAALLPLVIFALPSQGQNRVFTRWAPEVLQERVSELEELIVWCRTERLFGQRQRVCTFLLELNPDHAQARRLLGYRRISGEWKRSSAFRSARDYQPEQLPEAQMRIRAVLEPLRRPLLQDLQEHPGGLRRESVQHTIHAMLALDPNDAVLRAMVGETKLEGEWVLVETARALRRREELAQGIAKAREHAPPGVVGPIPDELDAWGLPWTTRVETLGLDVIGTVAESECAQVASDLQSLSRSFELAFGVPGVHREGLRVLLFAHGGEREVAMEQLELPPAVRRQLGGAAGGWLGSGQLLAEWDASAARRRDGAARQVLGTMLMDRFGIDGGKAWAWEGIGLYLVHLQLGSRGTWFFQGSGYRPVTDALSLTLMQDPALDWLAVGRGLLADPNGPRISFLLGRPLNSMTGQDLVLSYTLAAYLLEGWPDQTPQLLAAIGRGEHPVLAFERELGFAVSTLDQRIVRWIDETSLR